MPKVLSLRFQQCFVRFTMLLSKGPLKWDFLDINLPTFFGVHNFANTSTMRVMFFKKMLKILSTFKKCRKKLRKKIFFQR